MLLKCSSALLEFEHCHSTSIRQPKLTGTEIICQHWIRQKLEYAVDILLNEHVAQLKTELADHSVQIKQAYFICICEYESPTIPQTYINGIHSSTGRQHTCISS